MYWKSLGIASLWLLSACAATDNLVVGTPTTAIDVAEVRVFYGRKPDCEFDVVAYLSNPGGGVSRNSLIEAFKGQAAAIGANAIEITYMEKLSTQGLNASARAIRCAKQGT